jgi:regulatory protein YycH of two-component signal transduction system YycFG
VNRNAYISKAINEDTKEKYKKALFKDPLSVKSATTDVNIDTLTDGNAAMVINELKNRFTYTNFAGLTNNTSSSNSPLFLSIDYINSHGGWGGNPYILSELTTDQSGNQAGFWLYVDELPVLDDDMQMSLTWNENELYEYQRSMIELDTRSSYYPEDLSETVPLQSGEEVIDELIAADYNINYIKDVRIGFSLQRQSEPHIYFLEPKWFINYENQGWSPLFKEDREEGF